MSEKTRRAKTIYWRTHFQHQHRQLSKDGLARSLDYSNEAVLLQTYSQILEGAGELNQKSILDAGCGWGNFTLILHACGANVTGIDIIPETIALLRQRYPFISWQVLDLMDETAMSFLPSFDCIVAAEVFQNVDFEPVVRSLWSYVRPGGRLVASVPNSECPIVRQIVKRPNHGGFWSSVSQTQIRRIGETLADIQEIWMRGLTFQEDQDFLPYFAGSWDKTIQGTPNRIVFVIVRNK